ncbi:hypothetical protein C7375_1244 [Frischella perrara]|nr:hypothetical protein C7375_1244 [Frischella perrara]
MSYAKYDGTDILYNNKEELLKKRGSVLLIPFYPLKI